MTRSGVIPLSAGRIGRPTIDDQNHTLHEADSKQFQAAFNQDWTLSPWGVVPGRERGKFPLQRGALSGCYTFSKIASRKRSYVSKGRIADVYYPP